MTAATAALETTAAEKSRTLLAQANRLGARYHATWPLAVLLIPLIAIATVSSVLEVTALMALVDAGGDFVPNTTLTEQALRMSAISTGSFLLDVAVWSVWISVVIGNVPALVARWPRYGWISSLLGVWIPFINVKRPFAVVREVCSQLSVRPNGAVLLAAGWWLCILLWIFGSNFVTIGRVLGRSDATRLQSALVGEQFGLLFFVPAGIFAIAVVISIERLQRQALHRRETTVLMADGAAPA